MNKYLDPKYEGKGASETYVLFPLPESGLLRLDLLCEPLAQALLFLLELRVVQLLDLGLAELASLHLLLAVVLVVQLLGSVDKIKHVGADQEGTELLEVTVILIFN